MMASISSLMASFATPLVSGRGEIVSKGAGGMGHALAMPTGSPQDGQGSTIVSLGQSGQGSGADWQGGYGALAKAAATSGRARNQGSQLSPDEQRQVEKLKETDRKVRAHEQAHMAAGGGLVRGGASYSYQKGPDGQRYAVGGEVSIDTSPGRTPEETLSKAQQIRAAALAPADPSAQDRSVAAGAAQLEAKARADLAQQLPGSGASEGAKEGGDMAPNQRQEASGAGARVSRIDLFA